MESNCGYYWYCGFSFIELFTNKSIYIYNRKKKTQNTDIKLGEISSRKKIPHRKNTSDSKLDDLISEIELFTNKWHYKTFWSSSYRNIIENNYIKGDIKTINKIKEHP
ncbi:MAG: hypothetical protein M3M87_07945, partial [Thermoproteota archaeon]|nr:hypothetical protein [Thermoproteota archaeon]